MISFVYSPPFMAGRSPQGGKNFDLAAQNVKLVGRKLIGIIANNGPDNFPGGGFYQLGTGSTFVQKKGNIPPIPARQAVQVEFVFPASTDLPPSFSAFLFVFQTDDKNGDNNRTFKTVP